MEPFTDASSPSLATSPCSGDPCTTTVGTAPATVSSVCGNGADGSPSLSRVSLGPSGSRVPLMEFRGVGTFELAQLGMGDSLESVARTLQAALWKSPCAIAARGSTDEGGALTVRWAFRFFEDECRSESCSENASLTLDRLNVSVPSFRENLLLMESDVSELETDSFFGSVAVPEEPLDVELMVSSLRLREKAARALRVASTR